MKIYLIRHGQTDWNMEGKIQGRCDISLNETGKMQAKLLAKGMEKRPVTRIYSSRLKRALETAEAIGQSQQAEVTVMDGLEEVDFGEWEGMTWEEIEKKYPREFEIWCTKPENITPPGGESRPQIYQRVRKALERIVGEAEGDVAVVSHGAALAYIVSVMQEKKLGSHDEIIVKNVSISTVEYDRDTGRYTMLEANDVSHLDGFDSGKKKVQKT